MLGTLALALLIVTAPDQGVPTGSVYGRILSETTGAPLAYAVVEVVDVSDQLVAVTDSLGRYELEGVPAGRRLLRARHIDHAPLELEVLVPANGRVSLDLALELRPVRLSAVAARAWWELGDPDTLAVATADLAAAAVRAMEGTPGVTELGLVEAARDVPGHEPGDPSDVLFVRGSAADLKLVLLDGAPVFAPFHIGGLVHPFEPEVLSHSRLFLGGAPARYDGGLSYVLDLETRAGRGDVAHSSGGVDLLSARGTVEGPIGGHATYVLGGRAVHGAGTTAFVSGPFPYGYADGIARLDLNLREYGRFGVTGFWNQESVRLDPGLRTRESPSWGNTAASVRYRSAFRGSTAELTVATGAFRARVPLGGTKPLLVDGISRRDRFAADFVRPIDGGRLAFGTSFERLSIDYLAWERGVIRDTLLMKSRAEAAIMGIYADGGWQPARTVRIQAGMRTDIYSVDPVPRLAPRLLATWMFGERAALTFAAGLYRQYVRATLDADSVAGLAGGPVEEHEALHVARASHVVLGIDQVLGEGIRLGVEGYFKHYGGLPTTEDGLAQASGMDLWLRRDVGRLTGWFGYSLAWIWSSDDDPNSRRNFSGRHLVSAGIAGPLGTRGSFDVRLSYGAGLPYAAIPDPSSPVPEPAITATFSVEPAAEPPEREDPTSTPTEPYLRLDAQLAHSFIANWRGFALEIKPYFKVLNALDRRDALFYRYDVGDVEPRAIASLPLLPIVGMEWRF